MRGIKAVIPVAVLLGLGYACGYVPHNLWEKTWRYATGFGVDPYLVAAVVWVESGYCTGAVGKAGELGLGQFMPGTWHRTTGEPPGVAGSSRLGALGHGQAFEGALGGYPGLAVSPGRLQRRAGGS